MVRKRMEGTQFSHWQQVDDALREIGQIDRELGLIESGQNAEIDRLKNSAKEQAKPLLARKAVLELAMKEFCEARRAEFTRAKSKKLTFGNVGFRLSSKVVIRRVADTLQALKDLGLSHCIRQKEELDKDAMKNLSTETLAEVGASLKTDNAFGYEVDQERLKEVL